jgi:hypothetical protein
MPEWLAEFLVLPNDIDLPEILHRFALSYRPLRDLKPPCFEPLACE